MLLDCFYPSSDPLAASHFFAYSSFIWYSNLSCSYKFARSISALSKILWLLLSSSLDVALAPFRGWPISCAISYAMALSLAASTLTFCLPLLWPCSLMAPTRQWFPCLSWWLLVLPAYRTVSCAIAYALALSLATTLALTLECLQLWF
jgi:hypothetical protein